MLSFLLSWRLKIYWDKSKYSIIFKGSYAKFSQNENLRQFLIGTKDKVLIYTAPQDKIWGIGMYDDIDIENPFKWGGANLLGFALMEIRDEIIKVYKNYDKLDIEHLHKENGGQQQRL